jgi:hypothetical protein
VTGLRLALGALFIAGALVTAGAANAPGAAPEDSARVDFNYQIRPLLSDRCFRCHGPDSAARKAKLRLDRRDSALKTLEDGWAIVKPFDPDHSELVRRISLVADDDDVMPPVDSHLTLSAGEKALLRRWIAEGAEYAPHWSFAPVQARAPPATGEAETRHAIDAFVRARLARERLTPAPRASRETLIRRLAFTLTGLPPTVAEIDAFVADRSSDAWPRLVDRYLASPAYGERLAVDWLDLARYADTYGYQADVERDMSRWRDWVIAAFNDNLPYDQFLTWQLAGDLLPGATETQRLATAFNRLHRQTNEGGSIEEEFRTEYVADRVNTFGTAMLGLTLECARCHDHKFDPITQREYFSLFAFFNSIDESGLYSHFTTATPTPTLRLWTDTQARQRRSIAARLERAERDVRRARESARAAFATWRPAARVQPPTAIAHLTFDDMRLDPGLAIVSGVAGAEGGALRLDGDTALVQKDVRTFRRSDAFSIALRLQPTVVDPRAVLVHQSRAWSDAGSRGLELTLDHGRPFFALVHFWPGNAIAVRARQPLPTGVWSRLTAAYDGSSRAAGLALYLDGVRLDTEVVRDHLDKDIDYDKARDNSADPPPLAIGARFRDSGFRQGLIDDLQIYDVALTAAEVQTLANRGPEPLASSSQPDAALLDYFVERVHEPSRRAAAARQAIRREEHTLASAVSEIMVMEEMPAERPTFRLARGAYDAPRERVARDTPASLPPFPGDAPRNRLGLARWLTDPRHPLTARVVVNRVWRMHFGRGLVATQEDFGSQGRLPTHPDLLDWLASRFFESGWDVKALHRLILTSETFQQTSGGPRDLVERDPDNLRLARGPTVRLQAEQIRDSALAASGLVTRRMGGASVKPYQPAGLWEQSGTGKTYKQDTGAALYRRSLYTFWRRTSPPPSMLAFDAMSREVCTARRESTSTPLQALVLLNDPQFVEAARALAQGVMTRHPRDASARHRDVFRRLLGRAPDAAEAAILARLFAEQQAIFARDPEAAVQLLSTGESAWDRTLPHADLAATTMVASAIMNLDDFVVVR